jgi:hypothetical protein
MGVLERSRVYLCGPISDAADFGIGWRQEFTEKTKDLGLIHLDPTDKPGGYLSETQDQQKQIQRFREHQDWSGLEIYMKKIRRMDLRLVDKADFIVIYVDPNSHMLGSYDEILTAEDQQKPIFLIVNGRLEDLNPWIFTAVDHNNMFESVDSCVSYIRGIDEGRMVLSNEWVLIEKYLTDVCCPQLEEKEYG